MKTPFYFLIALSLMTIFQSCSSGRMAYRDNDDVYYTGSGVRDRETYTTTQENNTSTGNTGGNYNSGTYDRDVNTGRQPDYGNSNDQSQTRGDRDAERFSYDDRPHSSGQNRSSGDGNGNTYITNNYYDEDDYYDYAYSARIRRFYHPLGWSYYDPFYTNLYWYDYNPFSWGVSLYCTYNWWNPRPFGSWGPSWGVGVGFGPSWGFGPSFAYNPFWGNPWGNPWGWGGGGYMAGYNDGFMNGYYAGLYNGTFNPYYFNSLDSYSYYYGPRNGRNNHVASNVPGGRGDRNIGDLYGRKLLADDPKTPRQETASDGIAAIGRSKREIRSMDPEFNQPGRGNDGIIGKPRQDSRSGGTQEVLPTKQNGRVDLDGPGRNETTSPSGVNPKSNSAPVREEPPSGVNPKSNNIPVRGEGSFPNGGNPRSGNPSEGTVKQSPTMDPVNPGKNNELNPRSSEPVKNNNIRNEQYSPRGASDESGAQSPRNGSFNSDRNEPSGSGRKQSEENFTPRGNSNERETPARNQNGTLRERSGSGKNVEPSSRERRSYEPSRPAGRQETRPSSPQRSSPSISSPSPGSSRPSGSPAPSNRRR